MFPVFIVGILSSIIFFVGRKISQKFHNERAIFLARKYGIEAYGFNAKDVNKYFGFKTKVREYFARAKVFVDFLLGVEPKFGGEKVEIS